MGNILGRIEHGTPEYRLKVSREIASRIIRRKCTEEAFSGEGSAKSGPRWNQKGTAVVYCSESASLAQLEILVRMQRTEDGFVCANQERAFLKN